VTVLSPMLPVQDPWKVPPNEGLLSVEAMENV
jgi:hypothetical protein